MKWKLVGDQNELLNDQKKNHVKKTWTNSYSPRGKISDSGDQEYVNLWKEHFNDFSGRILEIGAGNGFLAKNILLNNPDVEYTILDLEAHFDEINKNLINFSNVNYVKSSEYEKVFEQTWDLIVETHCLSETPKYYYQDILEKLKVSNCFVIDYGNPSEDPHFRPTLDNWFDSTFKDKQKFTNNKLLGGDKRDIPVYIGKS